MNELDQFIKHTLKARFYIRYVDDVVLLSCDRLELIGWMKEIEHFLINKLSLKLHSRRRKLQPISNGIDFLGYIIRRDYILIRRRVINNLNTRLRHFSRINLKKPANFANPARPVNILRECLQSYLGHFKWANSHRLVNALSRKKIVSDYFRLCNYKLQPVKKA
jgi:hypothetical protein